jgi:arylsulfatase A-like enzyme
LVEKFYNVYEESIHIPLIVSNPIAFPRPVQTSSLASHVDLVPTLYRLLSRTDPNARDLDRYDFIGKDISPILDGATADPCVSVQASIHFTYDDIPCRNAPSIVRCIRTSTYKYAVYFTPDGKDADWELYDLLQDPLEDCNLAGKPNAAVVEKDLDNQLVETMKASKTLPTDFEWPPLATNYSRGVPTTTPSREM